MKLICFPYMIRYCAIVSCLVIFLTANCTYAVEVKDLYQAKVSVISQAATHRNKALKKAMQAVMVKVGGQENVMANTVIKKAVANHNFYVSQYTYQRERRQNAEHDLQQLMLLASFDENKINQLFQQAQLSLWGRLRPRVLLWLVEENELSRQIVSESSQSAYPALIQKYSSARGLPIIMPLMDLTDSNQIKITDIWGRFITPVATVSQRYNAEALVIVRISNSSLLAVGDDGVDCRPLCQQRQYALDWTLVTGSQTNQTFYQKYQATNRGDLLQKAISDITQVIYQDYALSANSHHDFLIDVANVDSVVSYMAIINFLTELSSVQSVTLVSAQGNSRRFKLNLLGSKHALLSSLKLNKQLQQYLDPLAEVVLDAVPIFYWGKP